MTQAATDRPGLANDVASPHPAMVGIGVVGLASSIANLWVVQPLQFNVVTYEAIRQPTGRCIPSVLFASVILFGIVAAALAAVQWMSHRILRQSSFAVSAGRMSNRRIGVFDAEYAE
jgi:hypothetical protein